MKNTKGITLVALVVTIVVLVILAGVSIYLLLGNNGVITRAKEGTDKYEESQANETEAMKQDTIDELVGSTGENPQPVVPSDWTNIKEIKESAPIPKDFYYVGGTVDTGVIISDAQADENKGESYEKSKTLVGNQFVWIPVPLEEGETFESKYPRTAFVNNAPTTGLNTTYTEPYASGYATETEEYNSMLTSVNKYKGFYVGRYESGCINQRTDANKTTEQTVVIKQGAFIYNYVPWGETMSSTAPYNGVTGTVELSKNLKNSVTKQKYTTVTSTLIYGIQWDMMLRYVADETHNVNNSVSWGNYGNSEGAALENSGSSNMNYTTGRNSAWSAKNIYDIAGNVLEWTMEVMFSSSRATRGGRYTGNGSGGPAASHNEYSPYNTGVDLGFRSALYL